MLRSVRGATIAAAFVLIPSVASAGAQGPPAITLGTAALGSAKIGLAVGSDGAAHVAWVQANDTVKFCRMPVGMTSCDKASTLAGTANKVFVAMTATGQPTIFTECFNCYQGGVQVTQWTTTDGGGAFVQRQAGASRTASNPWVIGSGTFITPQSDYDPVADRFYSISGTEFDAMPGGPDPTQTKTSFHLSPFPVGTSASPAVGIVGSGHQAVAVFPNNSEIRERHLPAGTDPDSPTAWTTSTQVESFPGLVDVAGNASGGSLFLSEYDGTYSVRRRTWNPQTGTFGASVDVASGANAFSQAITADRSEIDGRYHVAWNGSGQFAYATGRANGTRWTAPVVIPWTNGVDDPVVAGTSPGRAWIATAGGGQAHLIPIAAPPDAGGDPDIALSSAASNGLSLAAGETKAFTVDLTRLEESLGRVDITTNSTTLTTSAAPTSTSAGNVPLEITVTAPANAAAGSAHTVTVTATPTTSEAGSAPRSIQIPVTIAQVGGGPAVAVGVDPITIDQGEEATVDVLLRRLNGHEGTVAVSTSSETLTTSVSPTSVETTEDTPVRLSVAAPKEAAPGEHTVRITVTDDDGGNFRKDVKVTVVGLRSPPVVVSHNLNQTIIEGQPLRFQIVAEDAQSPPGKLFWFIDHLEGGSRSGHGSPAINEYWSSAKVGTHTFEFIVRDTDLDETRAKGVVKVVPRPTFTWEVKPDTRSAKPGESVTFDIRLNRGKGGEGIPVQVDVQPVEQAGLAGEPAMTHNVSPKATVLPGKVVSGITGETAKLNVKIPPGRKSNASFEVKVIAPSSLAPAGPESKLVSVLIRKDFNLVLEDIDVLQTVSRAFSTPHPDNLDNGRMIRGKKTIARVFVRVDGNGAPPPQIYLFAKVDGKPQPNPFTIVYGPGGLYPGPTFRSKRYSATSAFTATLPTAWTKGTKLELTAQVVATNNPKQAYFECGGCYKDNGWKETVYFTHSKTIYTNLVPAKYTFEGKVIEPSLLDAYYSLKFAEMLWPLQPEGMYWGFIPASIDVTPYFNCPTKGQPGFIDMGTDALLNAVDVSPELVCREYRQWKLRGLVNNYTKQGYVGAFAGILGGDHYTPGVEYPDLGLMEIDVTDPMSVAHEFGHYMFLDHSDSACQTGFQQGTALYDEWGSMGSDYGIDPRGSWPYRVHANRGGTNPEQPWTNGATTDPSNPAGQDRYDVMSYCAGNRANQWMTVKNSAKALAWIQDDCFAVCNGWNSLSRYNKGLPAYKGRQGTPASGAVRVTVLAAQGALGMLYTTGLQQSQPPTGAPTGLELVARDPAGAEIARSPLLESAKAADQVLQPLEGEVPAAAASFDVVSGSKVLATRAASAHAPTAVMTEPKPGAVLPASGTVDVRWEAGDQDGEPIESLLEYSADGGATWRVISAGSAGGAATIAASHFDPSTKGKLRVTVSDGWRTSTAESGLFTAPGGIPAVAIMSPRETDRPAAGSEVVAEGLALHPLGKRISDTAYSWKVDSRKAGTGRSVSLRSLAAGRHELELTVVIDGKAFATKRRFKVASTKPRLAVSGAPPKIKRSARSVKLKLVAGPGKVLVKIGRKTYKVSARPKRFTIKLPRRGANRIRYTSTSLGTKAKGTLVLPRSR